MMNWRELGLNKSQARSILKSGDREYCYNFLRALAAFRQVLLVIQPLLDFDKFSTFIQIAGELEDSIIDCPGFVDGKTSFANGCQNQIIKMTDKLLGQNPSLIPTILELPLSMFHELDIDSFYQALLREFAKEVETIVSQA